MYSSTTGRVMDGKIVLEGDPLEGGTRRSRRLRSSRGFAPEERIRIASRGDDLVGERKMRKVRSTFFWSCWRSGLDFSRKARDVKWRRSAPCSGSPGLPSRF